MKPDPQWRSLREVDHSAGQPKGSSFRAFKRLNTQWQEGRDFVVLHHQHDAEAIAQLRHDARIYTNSINVILLHPAAATTLLATLAATPPG